MKTGLRFLCVLALAAKLKRDIPKYQKLMAAAGIQPQ